MKKTLILILYYSPVVFPFLVYQAFTEKIQNKSWLVWLLSILFGLFWIEMFKTIEKKEVNWTAFSLKDKITYFVSMTTTLFLMIYPIKESEPVGTIFLFSLFSIITLYVIVARFGSLNLKKHIFPFW